MITLTMKYKALKALSEGPQSRSAMTDLVRSRSKEYRREFFKWLRGRVSDSYKINAFGPTTLIHNLNGAGHSEYAEMQKVIS